MKENICYSILPSFNNENFHMNFFFSSIGRKIWVLLWKKYILGQALGMVWLCYELMLMLYQSEHKTFLLFLKLIIEHNTCKKLSSSHNKHMIRTSTVSSILPNTVWYFLFPQFHRTETNMASPHQSAQFAKVLEIIM